MLSRLWRRKARKRDTLFRRYVFWRNPSCAQPRGIIIRTATTTTQEGRSLVGFVLAKEDMKTFEPREADQSSRSVLSFTIRDSPFHYVNISLWGKPDTVSSTSQLFTIGDIIQVNGGNVKDKQEQEHKYKPWTPSTFCVVMNDNHAFITPYDGRLLEDLSRLAHMPVQAQSPVYTLNEIVQNINNLQNETISFTAAVRSVSSKNITSKSTGKQLQLGEVKVFDQRVEVFYLTFWSKELIQFSEHWTTNDTIITAVDVKVRLDDYKKAVVATASSKTIITLNPDTREAASLYQFAQTITWPDDNQQQVNRAIDLSTIQNEYDVLHLIRVGNSLSPDSAEYGIIYCFLSTFDIDGSMDSVLSGKCCECGKKLSSVVSGKCSNYDCLSSGMADLTEGDIFYNVKAAVSDHTATLENCRISADAVSKMLHCKASAFPYLSEDDRTALKWQHLFERCRVVVKAYRNQEYPVGYVILQYDLVGCGDYVQHMH